MRAIGFGRTGERQAKTPVSGFFLVIYSVEFFIVCLGAIIKGKDFEPEHDFESTAAID